MVGSHDLFKLLTGCQFILAGTYILVKPLLSNTYLLFKFLAVRMSCLSSINSFKSVCCAGAIYNATFSISYIHLVLKQSLSVATYNPDVSLSCMPPLDRMALHCVLHFTCTVSTELTSHLYMHSFTYFFRHTITE
jgi:hypothetical protein